MGCGLGRILAMAVSVVVVRLVDDCGKRTYATRTHREVRRMHHMTRKTEEAEEKKKAEVLVGSSNRDEWRKEFFLSQYATNERCPPKNS